MKKAIKIVSIILVSIVLIIGGFIFLGYDLYAPKIFDYLVSKNPRMMQSLVGGNEDQTPETQIIEPTKQPDPQPNSTNSPSASPTPAESPIPTKTPRPTSKAGEVNTSMGNFTNNELNQILTSLTASDKTRIITILKSSVPKSEMPKIAKMASDGLDNSEKSYLENYMRSTLSLSSKQDILNIMLKYK